MRNTLYFRKKIKEIGYTIKDGEHPIVPIMIGEAKIAQVIAKEMLSEGIYVIGFSFPVVPIGEARIRVQISASHTIEHLDKAINAFIKIGNKHNIIN